MGLSWANHLLTGAGVRNHLQYLLLVSQYLPVAPLGTAGRAFSWRLATKTASLIGVPFYGFKKTTPIVNTRYSELLKKHKPQKNNAANGVYCIAAYASTQ